VDGPVVVLSHSIGTDHRVWDAQVAPLVAAGLRVVRYDHRGHGASPTPPGPYAIGDLGADVLALLDTLEVASASVVGISLGGMVALWLGAHAPGRVDRLVACCTSARIDPPDLWLERAAIARRDGMAALVDSILPRWVTPAFAEAHPEAMARLREVVERTPGEGYAGCAEAIAAMDQTADLGASARRRWSSAAARTSRRPRPSTRRRSRRRSRARGWRSSTPRRTWRASSDPTRSRASSSSTCAPERRLRRPAGPGRS
jgi:3-oxoadipate enol-lactonase